MRVGFIGGSSIFDLGDMEAMSRFSSLVLRHSLGFPGAKLLHGRIFRTYVRLEEIEDSVAFMRHVRRKLGGSEDGVLECGGLPSVDRFFDAFEHCAESSSAFYRNWKMLEPVRVARVDMPAYLRESQRSLDDIGNLAETELPFWQRVDV